MRILGGRQTRLKKSSRCRELLCFAVAYPELLSIPENRSKLINKIRCSHCHNVWETWNDITPDMPCPFCRAEKSLRPDIVFFGEEIMFTSVAEDLLRCADLFVAVGTSGEIPPASRFVWEAWKNGAKTLAFNLEPPVNSVCFDRLFLGKADETLPEFIKNQFMTV